MLRPVLAPLSDEPGVSTLTLLHHLCAWESCSSFYCSACLLIVLYMLVLIGSPL
ncbi:hypothetical protein HanXRQr2_Chr16g0734131 [Helianthus annuus]|uniref:Uncharacterized protein n=1 Tax=Helianthus annuus TaxID=4232 RepID=A0A9K3GWS9_HELAN|nr:hypothetical protein HanXRQr2_Chr16g0734131 [Helianthus annuus]KAJ0437134.1 hypothetical protein HanHA300_Chr16g0598581 [Helianthus annuus]KAJ0459446.1 hypothetical protein HanHA89_Chr16g0649051 [Helianthus annuus]KAJ0639971.1 hypothetical protein HanLR1_Chr16g0609841 [Helianthus annuus]KAJ0643927.1 hypothetical protein HanOQP8_Chr16g0606061 [Helianthus annuus]